MWCFLGAVDSVGNTELEAGCKCEVFVADAGGVCLRPCGGS